MKSIALRRVAAGTALLLAGAPALASDPPPSTVIRQALLADVALWGFVAVGVVAAVTGIRIVMRFVRAAK